MTSIWRLLASLVVLVLAAPLVVRGDHVVALFGLVTGFGGFWLILMARQSDTGGTLDNAEFWMAVGVVPSIMGCALLVLVCRPSAQGQLLDPSS